MKEVAVLLAMRSVVIREPQSPRCNEASVSTAQ